MSGRILIGYKGVGATAGWVIGNIIKIEGLSSMSCNQHNLHKMLLTIVFPSIIALLQIGFGYAFGVLFALCVCASTSGGHFNPCVTIAFCVFKKFPVLKAMRWKPGSQLKKRNIVNTLTLFYADTLSHRSLVPTLHVFLCTINGKYWSMNRKNCWGLQDQSCSLRPSSRLTVLQESSSHTCCQDKHSLASSWMNLSM